MDNQIDTTTETYTAAGHELMAKLRRVTEATRAVRDNAPTLHKNGGRPFVNGKEKPEITLAVARAEAMKRLDIAAERALEHLTNCFTNTSQNQSERK